MSISSYPGMNVTGHHTQPSAALPLSDTSQFVMADVDKSSKRQPFNCDHHSFGSARPISGDSAGFSTIMEHYSTNNAGPSTTVGPYSGSENNLFATHSLGDEHARDHSNNSGDYYYYEW